MNRYEILVYESRSGKVQIEAENEKEALDRLKAMQTKGEIAFQYVGPLDTETIKVEALNNIHLPRFEIFGKQALFADMARSEIDKLQGTDKLYRYDLRHGDDDSIPLTVEPQVIVNRFATIFTAEPLLAEGEEHREIGEDDWTFLSDLDDITPDQFYDEMQREKENSVEREATGLDRAAMQPGERLARKDTIQGRKEKHSSRPDGKKRSVREAIRDNQKSAKGNVKKGQSKDGKDHTL